MAQYEYKFEDIHDVISSDRFPKAGRNVIVCLGLIVLTIPVLLLYSQNLLAYPFNSAVCTLLSILLGGLAYVFTNQNSKKLVTILFYSIISIPLVFISLVVGGVLTLPLLFIFLDIRVLNEV
jgi:heme O synthase-like polyprenyltransferase